MAYVWDILGLYNDYSLATPLYNDAIIQAISASYSVTSLWILSVLLLSFSGHNSGLHPTLSCKTPARSFAESSMFPQLFT
jgi:hypothetical protein